MAMLFCMLSFITSLKYIDSKKIIWLILLPIFYFLGLLSKENSITFLAIIPLGLYYFRDGFSKKNLIVGGILLTTTIGYLLFRNHVIGYLLTGELSKDLMNNPFAEMNILERYCTIFYTLLIYLKLIFIPHPLTHDYYPYHIPMMHITNWQVYLSIFLHLNIMYVMFIWRKKRKLVSFAIFFYIISMSIVSNLFVDVGTFMNERFAFVSSLSACIILVYFAKEVAKKYIGSNKAVLAGILGVIILLYGYKTIDRLPAWESALTLNREAIKVSKNSARANSFMSTALFNSYLKTTDQNEKIKLLTEAKPYADKAVEVHPTYFNGHKMRVGIASELFKIDRNLDNLLIAFKETLIHRPDIPFIKTFLEYVHRFEDQEKLKAFYKDVCINELMVKQQNYQWAGYYLNLAMQLDASDPQLNKALRKCKSVLSNN